MYYCYLLINGGPRYGTYKGCTNNIERRLRQHNGEIGGGARSTTRRIECHPWKLAYTVGPFERRDALRVEWHWKHPRPRTRCHRQALQYALDRLGLTADVRHATEKNATRSMSGEGNETHEAL